MDTLASLHQCNIVQNVLKNVSFYCRIKLIACIQTVSLNTQICSYLDARIYLYEE